MGPLLMDFLRELHPVELARQSYVSEQNTDVRSALDESKRGFCIRSLQDLKTRFLEKIGSGKPQKLLVLHD